MQATPHLSPVLRAARSTARIGSRVLLGSLVLAIVGAAYQSASTLVDERANPPPGQLVDVGGYRLHIHCTGESDEGSPTVVLNHGGGGFGGSDFTYIQPALAEFTRVCAYDRAGYGWSDASPHPRTVDHETDELDALLQGADIPGPYVLVASSLGGFTSRMYATRHPERVAAMVLVDTTHENTFDSLAARALNAQFARLTGFCRSSTPVGLWRALGETGIFPHPLVGLMPAERRDVLLSLTYRPDYCSTIHEETSIDSLLASAKSLRDTRRPLGAMPIVILSAGAGYSSAEHEEAWSADQIDLLDLSTGSEQRVVEGATHFTLLTEYAPVVVESVRQVLARLPRRNLVADASSR